ncbi:hypothetical protein IC575_027958 [Cucumis melo]
MRFLFYLRYLNVLSPDGLISLTLTATIHSLRPQSCDHINTSITCSSSPSKLQYTILYLSIILVSLGCGGSHFTTATLGANQYDTIKNQNIFINWFFVTLYAGFVASVTAIVYIQDSVSWGLGFGICLAANAISCNAPTDWAFHFIVFKCNYGKFQIYLRNLIIFDFVFN